MRKHGPLYSLCENKDCIQVDTKKVLELTQGRFVPCNIFEQAKIAKTWKGRIEGDKWRHSSRMQIMNKEQLEIMVLDGIEKIDEYKKNPELESFLRWFSHIFMLGSLENYTWTL
jgi:hypothetical protein